MYIVSVCFGIVTISVLCTVIEIKTEVELICLAVCLGLSLEDLVLEQPIFKSAHNKKNTEGFFFQKIVTSEDDDSRVLQIHNTDATKQP